MIGFNHYIDGLCPFPSVLEKLAFSRKNIHVKWLSIDCGKLQLLIRFMWSQGGKCFKVSLIYVVVEKSRNKI